MPIYITISILAFTALIISSWILITAFIRGGTSKPEPKQHEYPPELKSLHDKFIGRR